MTSNGAVRTFRLPDAGEGLTEAEIITWRVGVGDTVAVNQPIVEIETAKAVIELPCPYAGIVTALLVSEGDIVKVGTEIISFDTTDAASPAPSVLVGSGPLPHRAARRTRNALTSSPSEEVRVRPLSSPPVRLLARQLGIDLATVQPSASDGRVRRHDLERVAATGAGSARETPKLASPQSQLGVDPPGSTRLPIRGVQRFMADAMVRSAFTAPHVTEWISVDVSEALAMLDRTRQLPAAAGHRLTPMLLVARALLRAVALHPQVNARWDGERGDILQYAEVNLGIAVATPRGLLVPNVPSAQSLSFFDLAGALTDLVAHARAGQARVDQLSNGTITITNIGVFGIDGGTPILNPGEAAILCMGQVRDQPWVVNGAVVARSIMQLTLSFDHRLIDGALGSAFLAEIASGLEAPRLLFDEGEQQ